MSILVPSIDDSDPVTPSSPLMWVELNQLHIQCIIGIYDFERQRPQDLIIDIALGLQYEHWFKAAHGGLLKHSLDYGRIAQQLTQLCQSAQFRLLESIYLLISYIFLEPPLHSHRVEIEALRLKITKPHALSPTQTPKPSVSGQITKAQWQSFFSLPPALHTQSAPLPSHVHPRQLLDLPEVSIIQLSSPQPGDLAFDSERSTVIALSSSVQYHNHHVSWSEPLSALYIEKRSFIAESLS